MTERCDLSDLPVEQCACRVHGPQPEQAVDPSDPLIRAGYGFEARFAGYCPAPGCEYDHEIEIGDHICRRSDGRYVHAECVEVTEP